MIDLKHEIERELSLIDPPDLWERIQADATSNGDAAVLDLTTARHRRRPSLRLAVAAVTALLAVVGALALVDDHQTVDTTPVTESPVVTEPSTVHDGPTTLAHGEGVEVGGLGELAGRTLNVDAVAEDGEVTGEFRVNNVVVTIQCADVSGGDTMRDLVLGGEVTDDPDGQGLIVDPFGDHSVAVGDLVALVIRTYEPGSERVTLFDSTLLPPPGNDSAGSCTELVDSVGSLDGGYFDDVAGGHHIETAPFSRTLAKGEAMEISGFGGLSGQTLSLDVVKDDGEVTGELRVNNVVVTIQCADTRRFGLGEFRRRDLILGGEVTDNADALATLDGVNVAVGDRLALILREDDPALGQRVTLYHPSLWYGEPATAESCTELVESVPLNLDGGFFDHLAAGEDIETG